MVKQPALPRLQRHRVRQQRWLRQRDHTGLRLQGWAAPPCFRKRRAAGILRQAAWAPACPPARVVRLQVRLALVPASTDD